MLYVNTQERSPLILYKKYLYKYIKKNDLRFSEQREQVLKTLHGLSNPITIEALTELINREGYPIISYTTTVRHVNFYRDIGWITVVNKVHKQYILVKTANPIT